jgi:hypothetical protein
VTFPRSLLLAAGSLVLMAGGATGPWAKVLIFTIHGTDDSKDGWIVVGAAGAALVFLILIALTRLRWLALVPLIAGGIAAATAAYDVTDISRFARDGITASTQWGIYVALVGSVALMLSSVLAIAEVRRPPKAVPPPVPPPDATAPTAPL